MHKGGPAMRLLQATDLGGGRGIKGIQQAADLTRTGNSAVQATLKWTGVFPRPQAFQGGFLKKATHGFKLHIN